MLIRVEHSTAYAYSEPLVASTQYLRLTPLSGRTQAVERLDKSTAPAPSPINGTTNTAIAAIR